jgi:phytanoyl-CoA hydroxylase
MANLSEQQLKQYEEDGFLLVPRLFQAEKLSGIVEWLTDLAANRDEYKKRYPKFQVVKEADAGISEHPLEAVRKLGKLQFIPEAMDFFGTESAPAAIASQIVGDAELRIPYCFSFAKPAFHGSEVLWHQDQMLWPIWTPTVTTCWVAIDECTTTNGCLQFVRGSQRDGIIGHIKDEGGTEHYIPKDRVPDERVVDMLMQPGDAVFFNAMAWHHSDPNRSAKRRLSFSAVYGSEREFRLAVHNARWYNIRREINLNVKADDGAWNNPLIQVNRTI